MRVATYRRVSTDETHQPYSLDAQHDRLEAYAKSQGWTIVRDYCDMASGAKLERENLQRALKEAKAGLFDLLLVVRVDRVSRSVVGLASILEDLDAAGAQFASATEPFDTTSPAGRMMLQMLGVFAEFERASIIERTIAGLEKKAAKGEWMQARAPLGYSRSEDGKYLVVDPVKAAIIDIIFTRYTERLEGTPTIARWLNEAGYRTQTGKRFSGAAVGAILKNRPTSVRSFIAINTTKLPTIRS